MAWPGRALALIVTALLPLGASARGSVGFESAVNYPAGTNPRAIALADFNGDGNQDVAVANAGDPSAANDGGISLLLGNGDGTLQGANNISVGKNPDLIAAADIDGDGNMDLLVGSTVDTGGTLSILLGNGDGSFQAASTLQLPGSLHAFTIGDFNRDSHPDLAISWVPPMGNLTLTIWLGNGDGTFRRGSDLVTSSFPGTTLVADFNGDHIPDLAVSVFGGAIDVLLGNGDGTFHSPLTWRSGLELGICGVGMVAGDVNGDGRVDLVANQGCLVGGESTKWEFFALLGKGDGTFVANQFASGQSGMGGGSPNAVPSLLADLDGDGKIDFLGFEICCASIALGDGKGGFQPFLSFAANQADLIHGFGIEVNAISAADVNNDKAIDIVTTNGNNTISVLLNKPGTDFSLSATPPNPGMLNAGQSATSAVEVTMLGAFFNPVSLSCSVQPVQAGGPICSLPPGALISNPGSSATVTLKITTPALALAVAQDSSWKPLLGWPLLAGVALIGTGFQSKHSYRRRKRLRCVITTILVAFVMLQSGCGGNGGTSAARTYTVTVTGAAGSVQHSSTVSIAVH